MPSFAPNVAGGDITVLPAAAAGVTVTAGAAGVAGSYAEVDDGSAVPSGRFRIIGVCLDTPSAAMIGTVEVAYGAGGSETLVGAAHFEVATDAGVIPPLMLPKGTDIAGSTRVAARLTTVAGGETIKASLMLQAL